ncbi:MAG: hypothetical protein JWP12_3317 [Bacteroidetes bacterium]|nr:hypothetical protein [Bacteroidota bacterium]
MILMTEVCAFRIQIQTMATTSLSITMFQDLKRLELANISNILFNFMKEELQEGNVIEIEMEDATTPKETIKTMKELQAFKKRFH